jgi:cell division protein FtsZ
MRISVVATGIDAEQLAQTRPAIRLVADSGPAKPVPQPEPAAPAVVAVETAPVPAQAAAIESAAVRSDVFIAPRPVEAPVRPAVVAQPALAPDPYAAAAMENGGRAPQKPVKSRGQSLFERVTGVGRRQVAEVEPQPRLAPTLPAQPRLGPLDPADRLTPAKDEDLLDIPAFLRRQAN